MAEHSDCVLRCNTASVPSVHEFWSEIKDYSPVLVIFPETQAAGPPWKQRPADYHPRDVRILLSECRDATKIRDRLATDLESGRERDVLDSGVRKADAAWRRYHRIKDDHPRTCYVNVVRQTNDKIAIQYWFVYYFNDYWNRHQADFEVVTVFLRRRQGALTPTACYYGAHHDGSVRLWENPSGGSGGVWLAGGTHPIAYVARGSHAFYSSPTFPPRTPTKLVKKVWIVPLPADMLIPMYHQGRRVTDDVVLMNEAEVTAAYGAANPLTYEIDVVPPLASIDPSQDPTAWNAFWWLRFKGYWGPGNWCHFPVPTQPGIRGMAQQERWEDPWGFLARCAAEIDWTEL